MWKDAEEEMRHKRALAIDLSNGPIWNKSPFYKSPFSTLTLQSRSLLFTPGVVLYLFLYRLEDLLKVKVVSFTSPVSLEMLVPSSTLILQAPFCHPSAISLSSLTE